MSESYLEKCIRSLPEQKQVAAREAVKAIAENGDDTVLSKLLVVFEATTAYAESIPRELVQFGEAFLRELDLRAAKASERQTEAEAQREERLRQLIVAQIPQLGKTLALNQVVAGLQAQTAELGRLARSVERLRHARVGGLVLLMLLGAGLGAGAVVGIFWHPYNAAQQSQRFVDRLNAAGLYANIKRTEEGVRFTVEGPVVLHGTTWRKNANGYTVGADFIFPNGGGL
jgi:hypothetical protein